jgi:hypothetical protein
MKNIICKFYDLMVVWAETIYNYRNAAKNKYY